ncbi:MAG: FMN-binding protein [Clostridiales bacterium]|jgi:electron transport complex protein RnfG|nr:FMN-binding protein [Clostridiales bacterium]
MKKEFVTPILVLTLICLFISAALAITNHFTEPVIAKAAACREEAARCEVVPGAGSFELLQADGLPATVKEVYKASNGAGYVFVLTVSGYGGDISIICGIAPDGTLISVKTLAHTETKGMGSKITEEPFAGQFPGKDAALDGVDVISGATISSKAFISAVKDAFTAYEIVRGVQ